MMRFALIAAFLVLSVGAAHAWLIGKPAGVATSSCSANITTSSGNGADILTASTTVVNNLTCQ